MRKNLAEMLLAKIMDWDIDIITRERPLLQAMSKFKYDEYQQFSIGTLFMESLVKWLNQFENKDERQIAYDFLINKTIFFSSNQILHLVSITFDTIIKPILISKAAEILAVSKYDLRKIVESDEYQLLKRTSLFIGLSDGAKIDQLRRSCDLNNEQVVPTYEISKSKTEDLLDELKNANAGNQFKTIFLLDDFTASGTSYFRKINGEIKGKIPKIISRIADPESEIYPLLDHESNIEVNIIFYLATTEAIGKIREYSKDEIFTTQKYENISIKIHVIQIIDSSIKEEILTSEKEFIELSKKHILKDQIIDRHWKKAKYEHYYLGYNECCLPVVLFHNTPNNSLPLLWWSAENEGFKGLFPRITRHNQ